MTEPEDYELERSDDAPITAPPERSTSYVTWAAIIVAALLVSGGIWYITSRRQAPPATTTNAPAPTPQVTAPELERPETPVIEAEAIDLPPLSESDQVVRELVARLSSHPTIAAWLATKGLITNFTTATLAIAEGRTPSTFLRPLAPQGPFRTTRAGGQVFVDARSYERYNPHGDAIAALDAAGTARLYLTLKPRITDAYRDLGYPEGDFDRVLERAIGVLLKTPSLDEPVALVPKGGLYAFSDSRLESLPPAQKQLLRMGPRSGRAIRGKLEEVAALLKLRPS